MLRLRLSLLLLTAGIAGCLFSPLPVLQSAEPYDCTRTVGYSNTKQWFLAGPFEAQVGTERWELVAVGGRGQIQNWASSSFFGWAEKPVSPCSFPVDRVFIDVVAIQPGQITAANVIQAANVARAKFGVSTVILQAAAGGPTHQKDCGNHMTARHVAAHAAISQAVAADARNVAGYDLHVPCGYFEDNGTNRHFTAAGANWVAEVLGSYYAGR